MPPARETSSLYDLLEVGANASVEEIEASYRRIVSYLAPDALAVYSLMSEDEASGLRSQLDEAYRTLRDPTRRAAYDRSREDGGYPQVLVPAAASGSTMSVGMLRADADDAVPSLDVDSIFRNEGDSGPAAPSTTSAESLSVRSEPVREVPVVAPAPAAPVRPAPPPPSASPRPVAAIASTTPRPRLSTGEVSARTGSPSRRPPVAPPTQMRRLVPTAAAELTAESEFSGALLRRLRESAGATLDDLARITKIRKHYLEAIEEHSFDLLPAAVYVRGFVTEYARVLGLDTQRVAASYMVIYKRYRGEVV